MKEITYDKNRVINFSDAVFSIVMTLLILEVAVPSASAISTTKFTTLLSNRIPDFIGLIVSFLVSALYWIGHIRLMKYVSVVKGKLLWLNIFFLLAIVILPFSTAMYVNGFNHTGPFVFYCINLAVIGFFNLWMLRHVYYQEKQKTGFTRLYYRWYRARGLNVMVIWIVASLIASMLPLGSRLIFLLLFVFQFFIDRRFKKKIKG
ncbi:TMEM175 family protein [uncultured Dokdonia sp.]|uniref:TMEM175 family protein n=1 Tax=uncultured Dokdonia sp. TaxID=575653 RepID=UPI0026116015|nr:TMEM175 family protein [uncultured Dokdonia sp.]